MAISVKKKKKPKASVVDEEAAPVREESRVQLEGKEQPQELGDMSSKSEEEAAVFSIRRPSQAVKPVAADLSLTGEAESGDRVEEDVAVAISVKKKTKKTKEVARKEPMEDQEKKVTESRAEAEQQEEEKVAEATGEARGLSPTREEESLSFSIKRPSKTSGDSVSHTCLPAAQEAREAPDSEDVEAEFILKKAKKAKQGRQELMKAGDQEAPAAGDEETGTTGARGFERRTSGLESSALVEATKAYEGDEKGVTEAADETRRQEEQMARDVQTPSDEMEGNVESEENLDAEYARSHESLAFTVKRQRQSQETREQEESVEAEFSLTREREPLFQSQAVGEEGDFKQKKRKTQTAKHGVESLAASMAAEDSESGQKEEESYIRSQESLEFSVRRAARMQEQEEKGRATDASAEFSLTKDHEPPTSSDVVSAEAVFKRKKAASARASKQEADLGATAAAVSVEEEGESTRREEEGRQEAREYRETHESLAFSIRRRGRRQADEQTERSESPSMQYTLLREQEFLYESHAVGEEFDMKVRSPSLTRRSRRLGTSKEATSTAQDDGSSAALVAELQVREQETRDLEPEDSLASTEGKRSRGRTREERETCSSEQEESSDKRRRVERRESTEATAASLQQQSFASLSLRLDYWFVRWTIVIVRSRLPLTKGKTKTFRILDC